MDVEHIFANDHFGSVHGIIRAHLATDEITMPFCGLWRFARTGIVEHWENPYDREATACFFSQAG